MTTHLPIVTTGEGPDVILLHGYPVGPPSVQPIADALKDSYRVHSIDMATVVIPDEDSVELLESTILNAGLEGASLIGHSLGAYRALLLAIRGRVALRSLVTIGALTSLPAETLSSYDHLADELDAGRLDIVSVATPLWFGAPYLEANPDITETVRSWLDALGDAVIAAQIRTLGRGRELLPEVSAISVPTLLLAGDLDGATPPAWSEAIAERLPGARLETFADAGHFPFMETPDPFFSTLRAFLANSPAMDRAKTVAKSNIG